MDASKKQREPVAFKSLAELKRFIRPGVEFKTVSHANHADMVGLTRVVTTVQTVGFYSKIKDQPEHPFSTCNHGKGFYTDFGKAGNYIFDGTTVKVKDKAVDYILQNERYAGNALLQKRYTTATLPKQQKINHGEREMYYMADSNEAIIPQELFDRAKELRQRRSVGQAVTHGRLCVRMRCSCGSRIRAKQVNGRWYWCCCRHDEKGDCAIKPVPEAQTDEAFRRLYYKLKHQSLPILEQMLETLRTIRDRRLLWSEDIVSLNKKISELSSQNQTLAFLKQNGLVDPDIFISKSNELTRQLRQAKLDKEKLMAAEGDATAQRTQELIALLEDGPDFLDRPDTELCGALVAEIIVESNDTLRFRLHNGLELRESIERTVR